MMSSPKSGERYRTAFERAEELLKLVSKNGISEERFITALRGSREFSGIEVYEAVKRLKDSRQAVVRDGRIFRA